MHLKRTHLVSAASFFPNSISRPYNYLSRLSRFPAALAHNLSFSLSPSPSGLLYRNPRIYTVMSSMTREMQISAEISRGIPARKRFFVSAHLIMSRSDWTDRLIFILILARVTFSTRKDRFSHRRWIIDVHDNQAAPERYNFARFLRGIYEITDISVSASALKSHPRRFEREILSTLEPEFPARFPRRLSSITQPTQLDREREGGMFDRRISSARGMYYISINLICHARGTMRY